jgi:hypothetical protein
LENGDQLRKYLDEHAAGMRAHFIETIGTGAKAERIIMEQTFEFD